MKALIVLVHKKGSKLQCNNYHGISLLSIPRKVYAKILDNRIRDIVEEKILEEQRVLRREVARTNSLLSEC